MPHTADIVYSIQDMKRWNMKMYMKAYAPYNLSFTNTAFTVISALGAYKIIQTDKMQIPHNQLSIPVFKSSFYHFSLQRYSCLKF